MNKKESGFSSNKRDSRLGSSNKKTNSATRGKSRSYESKNGRDDFQKKKVSAKRDDFKRRVASAKRNVQNKNTEIQEESNEFRVEGRNAVIELLKSGKPINKLFILKGERQGSINEIIKLAKNNNVIITEVEKAKLDSVSDTIHHQGVIAFVSPVEYKTVDDILDLAKERGEDPFIIIADEIEDPHNLGAIIRTAECAGCHGIIIPKRRSVPVTEVVVKTAVGAAEYVPVARVSNINETIKELQSKGVWVVGTDGAADKLYTEQDLTGPLAIVVGSEGKGISDLTMKNCDFLVKIPMMGKITSLNASVSAGVVVFEALRQRLSKKN